MTLLWKLLTHPGILRRSAGTGCRGVGASRGYAFDSRLTTARAAVVRVSRKGRLFVGGLRHRATSGAFGSDASTPVLRTVAGGTKRSSSELRSLILLAAPEKWTLMKAVAFLLVSSGVTMAVPFCFGKVIDVVNAGERTDMRESLNRLTLVLLVVFLVGGFSNFRRVYLMSSAGHRITQSLRRQAYAAILRQETAMFDKESTGELVGRLSGAFRRTSGR